MPSQQQKNKTLNQQKVGTYLKLLQDNEKFWKSFIVFLGALFILGTFPFYPIYMIPILAFICGGIAYKMPHIGTLLSVLLVFPAVAYQSAIFGWLFLLVIAITLFEMFESWMVISALEVLIFAPFAFGSVPFFGWITVLGMVLGSLYFGSKRSIMISIPSVMAILLLSSIWLVENNAFMPLNLDKYIPNNTLMINNPPVDLLSLPGSIGSALASLGDFSQISMVSNAMGTVFGNIVTILFGDSGFFQLAGWALVLFAISYVSGQIKGRRSQFISSLLLISIIPIYYGITVLFGYAFNEGMALAVATTIVVVGILEQFHVQISHEDEVTRSEKMKSFGKFGIQDMGSGGSEKSLADVGNYDDVKQELRDSIIMPLEKKELSYTYGIKPPAGILLFGPPGTGKTMLMRALAKELKYGFYYIKSSDILSQWYGESEKNISELFTAARHNSPSILFFDEIDSIGKKRTGYTADDVGPRILSILLQEIDGFKGSKSSVMVVGATNVPQQLDSALLRPGRFDKIIYMHLPEAEGREKIFQVSLAKVPCDEDIDFKRLAVKTERFSGADIKNVVDEAVRMAAKEANATGVIVPIKMDHLLLTLKKIKPSTSIAAIEDYERFKMDFERSVSGKEETKDRPSDVKWEDVAGLDKVKQAFLETIELPLLREDLMKEFTIKPSKGILLFGPPGTGKTLIVKAASNELHASFQILSGAEVMKLGYTQAVTVIKQAFNRARENAPSIVFIDEIETFAPARSAASVSSEIIGQLLTEMDGMKELKGVVVIAATNKPSMLDSAILRPGRFDKIFYIPQPDKNGRFEMFRIHLGKFAEGVNLIESATQTEGFSGADIAAICQEAKMKAVRGKLEGKEVKITEAMLLGIIANRRPSITKDMLVEYDRFRQEYGERG
ncbi:MAG: AAA family ATPase [Candidatus Micrarchaeia archaeon]